MFSDTVHPSSAHQIYMDWWQNLSVSHWKGDSHRHRQTSPQSHRFIYWSCQLTPCLFSNLGTTIPVHLCSSRKLSRISGSNGNCSGTLICHRDQLFWTFLWGNIYFGQQMHVWWFWLKEHRVSHNGRSHLTQVRRLCVCRLIQNLMKYQWWHCVCPSVWPRL